MTTEQKELILKLLTKELGIHKGKLLQHNKTLEMYKKQLGINITESDIESKEIQINNVVIKIDDLYQTIEATKKL